MKTKKIELYIHIPFCKSKCRYCDFCSFRAEDTVIDDYITKLKEELIKLKVRRSIALMKSYRLEDYLIEIDANADGKPLHILIGNESLCYEGTGKVIKRISGGEKILNSWSSLYAVDQY